MTIATSVLSRLSQNPISRTRTSNSRWLLTLALVSICLISTANSEGFSDDRRQALQDCLNDGFVFRKSNWNQSIEHDVPSNLKVEAMWSSQRAAQLDLTVITQLSFDRMPALFNQCSTYPGPIAAAVYLPLIQLSNQQRRGRQMAQSESGVAGVDGDDGLSSANLARVSQEVERLSRLHAEMDAKEDLCQLDLMFIWEVFDSKESALLYPVNSLRNYARMQVRTKLISAIDVDMMISTSLGALLAQPGVSEMLEQETSQRQAIVLPAFEPQRQGVYGRQVSDESSRATKEELEVMFKAKRLLQFKLKVFPRGHTPTDYPRWFQSQDSYLVPYQRMYEPWYLGHTSTTPFHDAKFRGYGLNKIAHVASLNYYNYSFKVHPGIWLIHRPHEDTAVRKVVAREASDVNKLGVRLPKTALYYKVTQLFGDAKRGMIRGTFNITMDPPMVRCYKSLTWLPAVPDLPGYPVDPSIFI